MAIERVTGGRDPESPFALGLLLVLSTSLVTGALGAAGFLLPRTVGALISGRALLSLELIFAGTLLTLLAALPEKGVDASESPKDEPATGRIGGGILARATERVRRVGEEVDTPVFASGVVIAAVVVVSFLVVPGRTVAAVSVLESVVFETGRGLLLVSVLVFVLAAVALAAGPWGNTRLGGESATAEFSYPAYVAMIFSAGIAAGIVFWGPVEALLHYDTVPPFLDAAPRSDAAAVGALQYTLFHWGVSAWSAYLAVGLPIAHAAYNRGAPLRVSSVLVPFLGEGAIEHPLGRVVDVLAVAATLGGLSTTLGFLSAQFLTGIEYRWGVELGAAGEVILVVGLTAIFAVSVVTGVRRGMRRFAALNSLGFLVLLGALAVVGPFGFVAATGTESVAGYVTEFVPMSLYGAGGEGGSWVSDWTIFYWSWWLSWAPFIGLFIARVSRGRKIRTVVITSVGATSLATLAWFVVTGGTALSLQTTGTADVLGAINDAGIPVASFPVFDALALGNYLLLLFLMLVITFFITSADAATRSLARLTTRRESPSAVLSVGIAALVGTIAAVLTIVGGRGTVQSAAVVVGGPFAIVGLLALVGLAVALRRDT